MRSALLALSICFFTFPSAAEAHTNHRPHHVQVTTTWTWVPGHWVQIRVTNGHSSRRWVRGHWSHPRHGKAYRAHRAGPPRHARPHVHRR